MITREALEEIELIVTHDNCPDGIASAILLQDALPGVPLVFANPNAPGLEPRKGILFCDLTPDVERAPAFIGAGAWVLDHHEKQRHIVEMFGARGRYSAQPGVSGAMLALEEVWRPSANVDENHYMEGDYERAKEFATLAGIRDTWQRNHPDWLRSCEQANALLFYPREMFAAINDPFSHAGYDRLKDMMTVGAVLLLKDGEFVQKMINSAMTFTSVSGLRVVVIPSARTSDVAEALMGQVDIVCGFAYRCVDGKPQITLSMRNCGRVDVGEIAVALGGGGHRNAAGATLPVNNGDCEPFEYVRNVIESKT